MKRSLRLTSALTLILVLYLLVSKNVNAQVTFSKDWSPGKRSNDRELRSLMRSANTVCHSLMNQIRQMLFENPNHVSEEEGPTIFDMKL